MLNIFNQNSKADEIVNKIDRLNAKRTKTIDKKNVKNSAIENKIHALEYKAWSNQVKADNSINQIDRELAKMRRDLQSEKDYINSVIPSEDKPRNVTIKGQENQVSNK